MDQNQGMESTNTIANIDNNEIKLGNGIFFFGHEVAREADEDSGIEARVYSSPDGSAFRVVYSDTDAQEILHYGHAKSLEHGTALAFLFCHGK